MATTLLPAGATTNPSVAAGVLKCCAEPRLTEYTTAPDAGSSAYRTPDPGSIAHTAPAAMIGDPRTGCRACHATSNPPALTHSAHNPSAHGPPPAAPDPAPPPPAPDHTAPHATCPPTPPT